MENNNKQTKSNGKTALIVFLLLVTIVAVILATYAWAKYTETFDDGEATASVAKWQVSASTGEFEFQKTFTHVVNPNKLAPGTKGSFTANLDVTGTEVDVAYTIKVLSIDNKPTNLIIKNSAGTTLEKAGDVIKEGTIAVTDETKTVEEVITWDWPWHTGDVDETTGIAPGDAQDTKDGQDAKEMKITYEVVAVQVQPE